MEEALQTKVCGVCRESLPISAFSPNKTCKYGVVGTCRTCSKIRTKQWYADNRGKRQEYANTKNRSRKDAVIDHFGGICFDCKQSYHRCVYQFHHLDPPQKDVNPSYAIANNPAAMWKELDKCVMLCANCHMVRHHMEEDNEAIG